MTGLSYALLCNKKGIFENELITVFVAKYILKAESNDHAKGNFVIDEDCSGL